VLITTFEAMTVHSQLWLLETQCSSARFTETVVTETDAFEFEDASADGRVLIAGGADDRDWQA
jgi:hypothetical protein